MDEVNERIKKNLDSDEWDKAKPKFDYHFSVDTLGGKSRRRSRPRSRPRGGARPDKKKEQSFRSFESKKKEKKRKEKRSRESKSPEPLVDLFESEKGIRVVAMFPEVNDPEELEIVLQDSKLLLKTNENEEELEVPFPVTEDPEVRFKNGIFDIRFDRK